MTREYIYNLKLIQQTIENMPEPAKGSTLNKVIDKFIDQVSSKVSCIGDIS